MNFDLRWYFEKGDVVFAELKYPPLDDCVIWWHKRIGIVLNNSRVKESATGDDFYYKTDVLIGLKKISFGEYRLTKI